MARPGALIWSTILFAAFGLLRLLATSGIPFVRNAFAPYAPLEYVFLFAGTYLFVWGGWGRPRLALILGFIAVIGYYVIATGAGF